MPPRFDRAVKFELEHETEFRTGHYGDDAFVLTEHDEDDPGGTTKYGIDQRSHPGVNIAKLTKAQAIEIYRNDYWTRAQCDALPDGFAEACFDIAVNNGLGQSAKMLQFAVGTKVDGWVGKLTLAAAQKAGTPGLLRLLNRREDFYRALVKEKPKMKKWLKGWVNRNNDLRKFVGV